MTERPKWTRLAPGVYDDNDGGLHLVLPELLAANGYTDTPEHRALIIEAMDSLLQERADPPTLHIKE
jgi:hypothetical protein